jgi:hypothetical protein
VLAAYIIRAIARRNNPEDSRLRMMNLLTFEYNGTSVAFFNKLQA